MPIRFWFDSWTDHVNTNLPQNTLPDISKNIDLLIKNEINEILLFYNFNINLIDEFNNIKFEDISIIKKLSSTKRQILYEFKVLFSKNYITSDCFEQVYRSVEKSWISKEKGSKKEQKIFQEIYLLLKDLIPWLTEKDLKLKIAFFISRNLFFLPLDENNENLTHEIEATKLVERMWLDLEKYLIFLTIKTEKISYNLDDYSHHVKSFIWRVLLTTEHPKLLINLKSTVTKKNKPAKICFVKSQFNTDLFFHHYSYFMFESPQIIFFENYGLNGGFHYLFKIKIIEPNLFNTTIYLKPELINFVKIKNSVSYKIDKEMLEKLNNEVGLLLSLENETREIEKNGIFYLQKIKKLNKFQKIDNKKKLEELNQKAICSTLNEKEIKKKKLYEKLIEKNILTYDPMLHLKSFQKKYASIFTLKLIKEFKLFFENFDDKIFFILYFDFRGRYYYKSLISPDKGWPFRFLFYFFSTEFKKTKLLLYNKSYESLIQNLNKTNNLLTDYDKEAILWTLISIGRLIITKKEIITENEFIEKGAEAYKEIYKSKDIFENFELQYYYLICDSIFNKNFKPRYLLKDVSASIFQNGVKLLGAKNFETLKVVNLNGDVWHDPYFKLINELIIFVPEKYKIYFNRKTLKKPIMVKYYNATFKTCFNYFIKSCVEDNDIDSNLCEKLRKILKKMYKKMTNLEKKILFKCGVQQYQKFLSDKKIFEIEYIDFKFNILNYSLKNSRIDIIVNNIRRSLTSKKKNDLKEVNLFKLKNKNSTIPNILQSLDAYFARKVTKKINPSFSIHDSFAISPYNVSNFIIEANELFNYNEILDFGVSKKEQYINLFSKFIAI